MVTTVMFNGMMHGQCHTQSSVKWQIQEMGSDLGNYCKMISNAFSYELWIYGHRLLLSNLSLAHRLVWFKINPSFPDVGVSFNLAQIRYDMIHGQFDTQSKAE